MLIDVHTHVNFKAFEKDGDEVIKRALDKHIGLILVGSQKSTSKQAVEYASKYPDEPVFAAIGLHPIHLDKTEVDDQELGGKSLGFRTRAEEFDYDYYKKLAKHPKVVAIGEVGLDYFRLKVKSSKLKVKEAVKKQKEVFRKQIELAVEMKKALMIHCRKAHPDCIEILKKYFHTQCVEVRGNHYHGDIHFFEGTVDEAKEYFKLGFTVSFTGVITFANAVRHQELVKTLPLERLLLETDAPYLTPEPHRGKRNEPMYVELVAKKIAELKNIPFEEVARVTTDTAKKVFGLPL